MSEGVEKPCYFCGESCVGQPRGKDPRGRYYHNACLQEAKAQADAADSHAPPEPDLLDDDPFADEPRLELGAPPAVAAPPVMSAKACPECGVVLAPGAVICVACGLDLRTGGHAYVPGKAPKKSGGGVGGVIWPFIVGPISILLALASLGYIVLSASGNIALAPEKKGLVIAVNAVVAILPVLLVIGGAQMTLRRQACHTILRLWAVVKISLTVLCMGCMFGLYGLVSQRLEDVRMPDGEPVPPLGPLMFITLVVAAISLIWPIFMLIWLRRDGVQREIKSW